MDIEHKSQIPRLLRSYGIQPTSQRVEIAHVLFENCGQDADRPNEHLSADAVLERVNADYPRVSKATVYNTLRLFEDTGLVRTVVVSASKVFYDANTEPHHHVFDEASGELRDLPAEEIDVDQLLPRLPANAAPQDLDIVVRIRHSG